MIYRGCGTLEVYGGSGWTPDSRKAIQTNGGCSNRSSPACRSRKARISRCGLKTLYVARRLPAMEVARKLEERSVSIRHFQYADTILTTADVQSTEG